LFKYEYTHFEGEMATKQIDIINDNDDDAGASNAGRVTRVRVNIYQLTLLPFDTFQLVQLLCLQSKINIHIILTYYGYIIFQSNLSFTCTKTQSNCNYMRAKEALSQKIHK